MANSAQHLFGVAPGPPSLLQARFPGRSGGEYAAHCTPLGRGVDSSSACARKCLRRQDEASGRADLDRVGLTRT